MKLEMSDAFLEQTIYIYETDRQTDSADHHWLVPGTLCTWSTHYSHHTCVCVCVRETASTSSLEVSSVVLNIPTSAPTPRPFSVHTVLMPCCCQELTCHMGPHFIFWLRLESVPEIWRIRSGPFFTKILCMCRKFQIILFRSRKGNNWSCPLPPRKHCVALVFFFFFSNFVMLPQWWSCTIRFSHIWLETNYENRNLLESFYILATLLEQCNV
jgi:hypothetical protein